MKKLLLFGLIALVVVSFVRADYKIEDVEELNKEAFAGLSRQQIINQMNIGFYRKYLTNNHFRVDFEAKSIEKVGDTYWIIRKAYETKLSWFNVWRCLGQYNFNVCYQNLVNNYNVIEILDDEGEVLEQVFPIKNQGKLKIKGDLNRILEIQDDIQNELNMTNFNNAGDPETPEVE